MLMWFVYLTKSQHATAQSHAAALSSHDKVVQENRTIKLQVCLTMTMHTTHDPS